MMNPGKKPDPAAALARRFDIANLRAQIRMAEDSLSRLDEFERGWNKFAERLGQYVYDEPWYFTKPFFPNDELKEIEALRLDLASRQDMAIPSYRDPLAKFLRTSLLEYSDVLWELIGVCSRGRGGEVLLPMDDAGDPFYEVDRNRFDRNFGEAKSEILRERHRLNGQVRTHTILLEEAERETAEALQQTAAIGFWQFAWRKFKESRLGRIAWWFVEDKTRNLIWLVVVVGLFAAVPSLRGCVSRAASWFQTRTDSIAPRPKTP